MTHPIKSKLHNGKRRSLISTAFGVATSVKHILTEYLQYKNLWEYYNLTANLSEIIGPDPESIQNLHNFLDKSKYW